jgi:transposase
LSDEDQTKLKVSVATLDFLMEELRSNRATLKRLRRILFGPSTEKTSHVLGDKPPPEDNDKPEGKRPGHGRNGASAYTGANKIHVPHPTIHHGDSCPHCLKGKVYLLGTPSPLVRITGMAPLVADVYERDQLRCNLCSEIFTAPSPEGVGDKKYDESATATVGLLKYGTGLPFNRVEKLQNGMGIPMPVSTQWELVRDAAELLEPAHEEMIHQAAQGQVLYNDDTTGRILDLTREQRAAALSDERANSRTGIHTSGIVSTSDKRKIALFFTGVKHAGENLADVLARRNLELPLPIQMCGWSFVEHGGRFQKYSC